jgi:hypothetical protein
MTERRAYAWGTAIVLAGVLLGAAAALWIGRPGSLGRSLAIALLGSAATGWVVLRWGRAVYGPRGALAALAVSASTPALLAALAAPTVQAPAGAAVLVGCAVQLVAVYALTRCVLDPTLQWVAVAGLAVLVAPVGAFLHGSGSTIVAGLAVFSAVLVVWRTLTAERCEPRQRVARAAAVSVALVWLFAAAVAVAVAALSQLPSIEEYSSGGAVPLGARAARPPPSSGAAFRLLATADAQAAAAQTSQSGAALAGLPLVALLLAAARPWRWARRYSDGAWVLALLCLGLPLWVEWGEPGGVFMTPVVALLAGACWDPSRPRWARRAATLLVLVQIVVACWLWPRWPGGVRSDAWLPLPDEMRGAEHGATR